MRRIDSVGEMGQQGRREPDGPARALLQIADKNPKAVLEALHS